MGGGGGGGCEVSFSLLGGGEVVKSHFRYWGGGCEVSFLLLGGGGCDVSFLLGAIQVLRNADGGGGVSDFPEKSVTKV